MKKKSTALVAKNVVLEIGYTFLVFIAALLWGSEIIVAVLYGVLMVLFIMLSFNKHLKVDQKHINACIWYSVVLFTALSIVFVYLTQNAFSVWVTCGCTIMPRMLVTSIMLLKSKSNGGIHGQET